MFFLFFFEYVLYFVIYLIINRKTLRVNLLIYIFIFIKSIALSVEIFYFNNPANAFLVNFVDVFIKMLVFYVSSYLVFCFFIERRRNHEFKYGYKRT